MGDLNAGRLRAWAIALTSVGCGFLIGALIELEGLGFSSPDPNATSALIFGLLGVVTLLAAAYPWWRLWRATANAPKPVPPGWYPDPAGSGRMRWWDGVVWRDEYGDSP